MIKYIRDTLEDLPEETVAEIYGFLKEELDMWKAVILMYLIGYKGVWTNRNATVPEETQLSWQPFCGDQQNGMEVVL